MLDDPDHSQFDLRPAESIWLVVGLGNPGEEYADTYHNVGFRVVEKLAARLGVGVNIRCGPALISNRVNVGASRVVLVVLPQTFMNRSGAVLPKLFERFETSGPRMIAVFDDVALPLGRLRIRLKGSAGGHNGVRSLVSASGTTEFPRVRVGILPDRPVEDLREFVLSRIARQHRTLMGEAETAAADAVWSLLADGAAKAMAAFNSLDLRESKEN
jgi:PTH1 family peptidyl-tRNA hydrolase